MVPHQLLESGSVALAVRGGLAEGSTPHGRSGIKAVLLHDLGGDSHFGLCRFNVIPSLGFVRLVHGDLVLSDGERVCNRFRRGQICRRFQNLGSYEQHRTESQKKIAFISENLLP